MIIKTHIGDFNVRSADNFGGLSLYNEKDNIQMHATYHKSINAFSVGEIKTNTPISHKETQIMLTDALQEYADSHEDWEDELKFKSISESMDKVESDLRRIRKIIDEEGWEGLYKRDREKEVAKIKI